MDCLYIFCYSSQSHLNLCAFALGCRICGGVGGDPERPEIRVMSIVTGSIASMVNIQVGDIVHHVNHRKLDGVTIQTASKILQKAHGIVAIGLCRKPPTATATDEQPTTDLDGLPSIDDTGAEAIWTYIWLCYLTDCSSCAWGLSNVGTPLSPAPPPPETEESFGFPPSSDTEEENGFDEPEMKPEPEVTPPTPATSDSDARAEKLRKMKEARAQRKSTVETELVDILAWIDNLDEETC